MTRPRLDQYRASVASPAVAGGRPRGAALLSVVTVARNALALLPETLRSVRSQGQDWVETVVVDGASTDGTAAWLRDADLVDRWISEPDRGIYDAMNKGVALAHGRVVGFLNAGDSYCEGALESVRGAYLRMGDDAILFGDHLVSHPAIGLEVRIRAEPKSFRHKMAVCHEAVFVPLRLFEKIGLHDLEYSIAADFELLAGEYFRGRTFHNLDRAVTRFESGGASSRAFVRYRHEMLRAHYALRSGHLMRAVTAATMECLLLGLERAGRTVIPPRWNRKLQRAWFTWRARSSSR